MSRNVTVFSLDSGTPKLIKFQVAPVTTAEGGAEAAAEA